MDILYESFDWLNQLFNLIRWSFYIINKVHSPGENMINHCTSVLYYDDRRQSYLLKGGVRGKGSSTLCETIQYRCVTFVKQLYDMHRERHVLYIHVSKCFYGKAMSYGTLCLCIFSSFTYALDIHAIDLASSRIKLHRR